MTTWFGLRLRAIQKSQRLCNGSLGQLWCNAFGFLDGFPQLKISLWLLVTFIHFIFLQTVCIVQFLSISNHEKFADGPLNFHLSIALHFVLLLNCADFAGDYDFFFFFLFTNHKQIKHPTFSDAYEVLIKFTRCLLKHCLLAMSNIQGYFFFLFSGVN